MFQKYGQAHVSIETCVAFCLPVPLLLIQMQFDNSRSISRGTREGNTSLTQSAIVQASFCVCGLKSSSVGKLYNIPATAGGKQWLCHISVLLFACL